MENTNDAAIANDERLVRIEKLERMKSLGIHPHPERFDKKQTAAQVLFMQGTGDLRSNDDVQKSKSISKLVSVAGRIVSLRRHGRLAFVDIQDETGVVQVCLLEVFLGEKYKQFFEFADLGDFIGVHGEPAITRQGKLAVVCAGYVFLGKSLRPLPSKFYGLEDTEKKYRQRYLDTLVNKDALERFLVRSRLVQEIRSWLLEKKFVEVNTRILQPQAGGAMAKPFMTHHNALNHDFSLRISPELDLKMSIICGLERVFEFATNFRNEGIDPSHLQEFQMLEWYCSYENFETGLRWTEEIFNSCIPKALGTDFFSVYDRKGILNEINVTGEYRRLTFADLLKEYGVDVFAPKEELLQYALKIGIEKEEAEGRSRGNLLDDIYKKAVRPNIIQPTFITHYPSDLLPLARPNDNDPRLADSYQLVVASWEVVKGYSELVDPVLQRTALEEQAKARFMGDEEAMVVNEEYLAAMEHGMPPITGCGIGIDRLATLITGQKNLRDGVLFPLMKPEDEYEYI